jgi:hypothetical protein
VAGKSRQHKSEKRRKELSRQARQKEKRERRSDKTPGGGGPPIDWSEAPPGVPLPDQPVSEPAGGPPEEPNP